MADSQAAETSVKLQRRLLLDSGNVVTSTQAGTPTVPRRLSHEERTLLQWLLSNGSVKAASYLPFLDVVNVCSECPCGCATIEFCVPDDPIHPESKMSIIADFQWHTNSGHLNGCFVYSRGGYLAGLEVWSIDGLESPRQLPHPNELILIVFNKGTRFES